MKNLIILFFVLIITFGASAQEVEKKNNFGVSYYSNKEIGFHFNQRKKISFEVRYRLGESPNYSGTHGYSYGPNYGAYGGYGSYTYFLCGTNPRINNSTDYGYLAGLVKYNKDILKDKVAISTGVGFSFALSSYNSNYILVPLDVKAYNLFNTSWLACTAGVDLRISSGLTELVPKAGLMINF